MSDKSEWKEGAGRRRDDRATKTDLTPKREGKRAYKNTKLWCKGKVGRKHLPLVELSPKLSYFGAGCNAEAWFPCRHHEICTVCGKELQFMLKPENCPVISKQSCSG